MQPLQSKLISFACHFGTNSYNKSIVKYQNIFLKRVKLNSCMFSPEKKNKENALAGKIKNKYFLFKSHYICAGCNRFHNLLFLKQHFYILFRADDEWKLMRERHAALLINAFNPNWLFAYVHEHHFYKHLVAVVDNFLLPVRYLLKGASNVH